MREYDNRMVRVGVERLRMGRVHGDQRLGMACEWWECVEGILIQESDGTHSASWGRAFMDIYRAEGL